MSYVTCPTCGFTIFDRNPLATPARCTRCAARRGLVVRLKRVPGRHAAAASVLGGPGRTPQVSTK